MRLDTMNQAEIASVSGGMAEWSKAAVLKTVDRKVRGFESLSLRHGEVTQTPRYIRII